MSNDEVYRCHACLSIPTDARYGSLNLAQAVQLIAYEWRQALGGFDVQRAPPTRSAADDAAVQGALDHWRTALVALRLPRPAAPKKLMPRLQQLLNRAQLTREEVHILRGIARAVGQRWTPSRRPWRSARPASLLRLRPRTAWTAQTMPSFFMAATISCTNWSIICGTVL